MVALAWAMERDAATWAIPTTLPATTDDEIRAVECEENACHEH
jgi:hypothetical protein